MPNDTFGFGSKRRIDLSDIPTSPPEVTPEREAAALERGEALGFVAREPLAPVKVEGEGAQAPADTSASSGERVVRQRTKRSASARNILIRGPEDVLDEFVRFVNDQGFGSYWEGLRYLMDNQKAD